MEIDPVWLETDFYEALGVRPDAERSEITRAYRRLARDLHPDTNADPAAGDRFKDLTAAYDVLGDPETRAAYDRARRTTSSGRTRRRPGGGYTIQVDHLDDPRAGAAVRAAHRLFGRRGNDLTLTVPVTFTEAARGADVAVPTLEGESVTVRIPRGTPSGRVLRVRGRGVPTGRGRGDLLVTVVVHVPGHLTDRQEALLDELADFENPQELRAHLEVNP